MLARVGAVQAGLIGENDQCLGLDQVGDQCPQRVVVAEADLVGYHRVVLIDDRYDTQAQQRVQGAARIQVASPVGQVLMGKQYLRGAYAVAGERHFVGLYKAHLPDRRRGLEFMHGIGPARPTQARHALGDGAAGNQHHLLALGVQAGDLGRPLLDSVLVYALAFVGDERGAYFDDQAFGMRNGRRRELSSHVAKGVGWVQLKSERVSSKRGSSTTYVPSALSWAILVFWRSASSHSWRCQVNSWVPSPVSAEMLNTGPVQPSASHSCCFTCSGSGTISSLFRMSQRGFSYRAASYRRSSSTMARASFAACPIRSASGSGDDTSTRCSSTRVRDRWRRNRWPSPAPSEAPSIRPGISAMTKLCEGEVRTTPRL